MRIELNVLLELLESTLTKERRYHHFLECCANMASQKLKVCGSRLTILGSINKGSLNHKGMYSSHLGAPMLTERRTKVVLPIMKEKGKEHD